MLPNIDQLTKSWSEAFPLTSYLIATFLQILIQADHDRLRALESWNQIQHELYLTGLPMHHWDLRTLRTFHHLRRHHHQCQRHFNECLKTLEAHYPKPSPSRPEPEKPSEPEPKREPRTLYLQNIKVKVVDGETITTCDESAAYWLAGHPWYAAGAWERQFQFADAVVPCQYEWILRDPDGSIHPPAQFINVRYTPADFLLVCQREIDTNSEYLLPGRYVRIHRG